MQVCPRTLLGTVIVSNLRQNYFHHCHLSCYVFVFSHLKTAKTIQEIKCQWTYTVNSRSTVTRIELMQLKCYMIVIFSSRVVLYHRVLLFTVHCI